MIRSFVCVFLIAAAYALLFASAAIAAEPAPDFRASYADKIRPLLATHCQSCHGQREPEGKLDLTLFATIERVAAGHEAWQAILERLEAKEMPPEDAKRQLADVDRKMLIDWIRGFHADQAKRNVGDPGVVPARRLNAAEYNYTIRDLIGFDIQPAKQFPIDPANEAGFDNSSQSLAMSPGLAKKYVEAARFVAEHLVLKPQGFDFAPHAAMTDTDRDKYCVNRLIEFYQRQPTDLADYFLAAWRYKHRVVLGKPDATLAEIAAAENVSPKYLAVVWSSLSEGQFDVGPMAKLQKMWGELPAPSEPGADLLPADEGEKARAGCVAMRYWVKSLRRKLEPSVKGLKVSGVHEGSQSFVLWKNRQYAANRRTYSKAALQVSTPEQPAENVDLAVPADETERGRYEASFAKFCDLFPDAFYVSERGRDYVGKAREQQEKGRLLSAGFHSQMGYFRDDQPLCDLIIDETARAELAGLWQELDFIANVPLRQLQGFLWFERTDSRYMRDPEFDPFRAEDKNATSGDKIARLAEVYLAKARANGGGEVELQAIADYFREMDERARWVEQARAGAESSHLDSLVAFANRAYRRPLIRSEADELVAFYRSLRADGDVTHEEAIQDTLVYILMSPQFCYRMDLAAIEPVGNALRGVPRSAKTRPLNEYELASRLSYFLWSSMPDAELLKHARNGDLHEPTILTAQVKRMLADDRSRALAVEFGGNWLDFRRFEQHNSVDRGRFPTFTNELRQAMYEEPVHFFVDLIQRDGSVLDFLYAKHTFVNGTLAEHYDLPDSLLGKDEWVRIDDAAEHGRGGLLPMAVFLTQNAPGLRTSPVKRGYWVVRRILGERIPAPPPNVPELPADESKLELSLRETLAKHRDHAACSGCHERFDSLGLVFEGYGPIGERRHSDLAGRPVDTRATFPAVGRAAGQPEQPDAQARDQWTGDGGQETGVRSQESAEGLDGLRSYLQAHRQEEFVENLSRKLLSYALGRTLLPSDDPLIAQMRQDLSANDHRFTSLIETIVSSQQFLTKRQ
jgi:mono/diheme cytochrome c family protein